MAALPLVALVVLVAVPLALPLVLLLLVLRILAGRLEATTEPTQVLLV